MAVRLRGLGKVVMGGAGLAAVILLTAWIAGAFEDRLDPGMTAPPDALTAPVVTVALKRVPQQINVVGSIRAINETAVGSRLLAPVRAVHVIAGQTVAAGDVLVELDQIDIQAKLRRESANLDAARARAGQAKDDLDRVERVHGAGAATDQELDDIRRRNDIAMAEVEAARQAEAVAATQLSYATVTAPFAGRIVDRQVNDGDLVRPGDPLVTLYDRAQLQLVAAVPERIGVGMTVGDVVEIELDALGVRIPGVIQEIVPQATVASRSMTLKVNATFPSRALSGMFGRVLITVGERAQLSIPAMAVRDVGQLRFVRVVTEGGALELRAVRTADPKNGSVEVLSGLIVGEQVAGTWVGAEEGLDVD